VALVLFAVWCFLVALAGGLVGLVLGNLRLPATLLVASNAAAGTGANLIASAVAAAAASVAHIRARRVDWRLFAWMAPPSVVGGLLGGYVSGVLPRRALLVVIAVVLFHAAFELFVRPPGVGGIPSDESGRVARGPAVIIGAVVGFVGGVVGLILGSLRMPAMLRYMRVPARRAAATNVTVGFLVGVSGAVGHLPSEPPDWTVAAVGAAASIPGALLGSRLTGRLAEPQLIRAIAWILLVVAVSTAVQAVA
jgi:uncharacterized membrane protein YfcA